MVVELILITENRYHRNIGCLGKGLQRRHATRLPIAPAIQDQRALCLGQQRMHLRHRAGIGGRFGHVKTTLQGRHIGLAGQHVFGQGHNHRAGAAGGGGFPRPRDDFGYARDIIDFHGPFDHGAKNRFVIQLLKGLAPLHLGAHLAHQQNHRRAILHRGMHPDRGIGGPRPARHHANARLARQLAMGRGHKGRAALVAAQHIIQLALGVV